MQLKYDKESDSAYISLSENTEKLSTDSFAIEDLISFGDINFDFDENKKIVGIEILNASKYLNEDLLK